MSDVKRLVDQLKKAQRDYYRDGSSILTDSEYDEKSEWLKNNYPEEFKLLEVIGSDVDNNSHWKKFEHRVPLGSLNKCNTFEEFKDWASKFKEGFTVDEKLDGISIALYYKDGILINAVTRGTGEKGDDILRNVKRMSGVKLKLSDKHDCIIRGEIVLNHSKFNALPDDLKGKNPRNTAAGAAKKLNGELCEQLDVIVYDVLEGDKKIINEFPQIAWTKYCKTVDDVKDIMVEYTNTKRDFIDWDIDGLVVKAVGNYPMGDWKKPKNAIAWKFEHQSEITTIRKIRWQVSGERINPVAEFDPVEIAGVTVSKASVHNWKFILENAITSHCEVEVTRRNDVIPHVERVIKPAPKEYAVELSAPIKKCPVCDGKVEFATNINGEELEYLVCTNPTCSAKAVKNVLKWFETHDCKGVAQKTVELIKEEIGFDTIIEFLEISDDEIIRLDGMGESKVKNLREQIEQAKQTTTLEKFFGGLNMNGFGKRMIRKVIDHMLTQQDTVSWQNLYNFMMDEEKVKLVEGFSDLSAKSINKQLYALCDIIKGIFYLGFSPPVEVKKTGGLDGQSFCFTGSLDTMKRKDAEEMVKAAGGKIGTVNKTLTYLVTNDPSSGSSKNKKATDLGVKIITENQFLEIIK